MSSSWLTCPDSTSSSMIAESFLSHSEDPEVGDMVLNINPSCDHYKSAGVVLRVNILPHNTGKTAVYKCTNSGKSWKKGEVLEKTLDQIVKLET